MAYSYKRVLYYDGAQPEKKVKQLDNLLMLLYNFVEVTYVQELLVCWHQIKPNVRTLADRLPN